MRAKSWFLIRCQYQRLFLNLLTRCSANKKRVTSIFKVATKAFYSNMSGHGYILQYVHKLAGHWATCLLLLTFIIGEKRFCITYTVFLFDQKAQTFHSDPHFRRSKPSATTRTHLQTNSSNETI